MEDSRFMRGRMASLVAAENGFRDVSHDLEIFGTCADC